MIKDRQIVSHHDGHGLNEKIVIDTDQPDQSGAAHRYSVWIANPEQDGWQVASVQFQQGPRNEPGSKPGVTEAVLYAILIDRLRGFQAGPYACEENADQLSLLEECLRRTKARADERARRGVLGKNLR